MHTHEIWTLNDTTEPAMMIETDGGRFICRAHRKHAPLIVRAVNAHATLVAALENARSIVRAFTGDLLAVPKSQSDAGYVDSVAWTVQQEIEAALHLAKHGSSQVEQPR